MNVASYRRLRLSADTAACPQLSAGALVLALFLLACPSARCGVASASDAAAQGDEVQADWISRQLQKDMMYGSDDFFGEDTELSFVDGVLAEGHGLLSRDLTAADAADRDHQSEVRPPDTDPPPEEEPPPV